MTNTSPRRRQSTQTTTRTTEYQYLTYPSFPKLFFYTSLLLFIYFFITANRKFTGCSVILPKTPDVRQIGSTFDVRRSNVKCNTAYTASANGENSMSLKIKRSRLYYTYHVRYDMRKYFFTCWIINLWNSLPVPGL